MKIWILSKIVLLKVRAVEVLERKLQIEKHFKRSINLIILVSICQNIRVKAEEIYCYCQTKLLNISGRENIIMACYNLHNWNSNLGKGHKKKSIFYSIRCIREHSLNQHCTIIILLYSNNCFKKSYNIFYCKSITSHFKTREVNFCEYITTLLLHRKEFHVSVLNNINRLAQLTIYRLSSIKLFKLLFGRC